MPDSDVRISGGIFLLSFTYWSKRDITRAREHVHLARVVVGAVGQLLGLRGEALAVLEVAQARAAMPSTSTFTVPSGSFSICRIVASVPISYMSFGLGSSLSAASARPA